MKNTPNHFDEIVDCLFVGDAYTIIEKPRFFDLIVNCCPDVSCHYDLEDKKRVVYVRIHDHPWECSKLTHILQNSSLLDIIHRAIQNKQRVLVHCAMGIQRSATVVACYLRKYCYMEVDDAITFILSKRPITFSNGLHFRKTISSIFPVESQDLDNI